MRGCDACRQRTARGFGWQIPWGANAPIYHACSMLCLGIIHDKRGQPMIDPDEHEARALDYASEMGGEYLESIGVTDLATVTAEQWATLVACIVTGYGDKLRELLSNADDDGD